MKFVVTSFVLQVVNDARKKFTIIKSCQMTNQRLRRKKLKRQKLLIQISLSGSCEPVVNSFTSQVTFADGCELCVGQNKQR